MSSSPTWTVTQGRPWSSIGRRRWARASAARASSVPRLVERDARRRHMHERARRVVAEARLLDERLCRPRVLARASSQAPCFAARSASCACARKTSSTVPSAPAPARSLPRGRPLRDRLRRAARAQRLGRAARSASRRSPGELLQRQTRRRRAPARRRSASCAPAASATQGSIVALPSESGIAEVAPSARASHRSASAGRPVSARNQAPIDGERGVPHQLVVAEPAEPLLQGLHAAVVVERQRRGRRSGRRRCPSRPRRARRRLAASGHVVGDAPGHRTTR